MSAFKAIVLMMSVCGSMNAGVLEVQLHPMPMLPIDKLDMSVDMQTRDLYCQKRDG